MVNCREWSVEFDQYYQNITSNQAPGLTEYDKSLFLTREQEAVIVMLYNGTLSKSFEETEELTMYMSTLVTQAECDEVSDCIARISTDSHVFELPDDLLFRTLEICKIDTPDCGTREAIVVPVTQDEYWRTSRNPFKNANGERVLRLTHGEAVGNADNVYQAKYSEIISKYPVSSYVVRYIRKPEPIILTDLSVEGLSINGKTGPLTCQLPEYLHQTILTGAVRAARAAWLQ